MRYVRFPGGAVGEIPDPPDPLPSVPPTEEELTRWESKIDKFHPGCRDTILRLVRAVRAQSDHDWDCGCRSACCCEKPVASPLFDRQREEIAADNGLIFSYIGEAKSLREQVASLSSQLERLTEVRDDLLRVIEGQNAKVERLKAEQMTAEEAQHALDQIPDNQCGWPPEDCPVCDSLREKLRRQSDTGAHQE